MNRLLQRALSFYRRFRRRLPSWCLTSLTYTSPPPSLKSQNYPGTLATPHSASLLFPNELGSRVPYRVRVSFITLVRNQVVFPCRQGNVYKQVLADLKARASTLMELRKHHVPTTEVSGEVESIRAVLGEFGTGTEYAQYFRKWGSHVPLGKCASTRQNPLRCLTKLTISSERKE